MEIAAIKAAIQEVNNHLQEAEPKSITYDDYKENTGYKPQYVIDAMNNAFMGSWGFNELSSEIVPTPDGKGLLAVCKVEVWIEGINWKPSAYGESNVTRGALGDARKGAQTDALKKALCYFSIGSRAYKGEIPYIKKEVRLAQNNRASNNRPAPTNKAPVNQEKPAPVPPVPAAQPPEEAAPVTTLNDIPTVSQLREKAKKLGLDWEKDVLPGAFKTPIAEKQVTLKQLIIAGNEIHPDGCRRIARYLSRYNLAQQQNKAS